MLVNIDHIISCHTRSFENYGTINTKIIASIISNCNKNHVNGINTRCVLVSKGVLEYLEVSPSPSYTNTSMLSSNIQDGSPLIGVISGVSVFVTDKLSGMNYFIGNKEIEIERFYRKQKIDKLLKIIKNGI